MSSKNGTTTDAIPAKKKAGAKNPKTAAASKATDTTPTSTGAPGLPVLTDAQIAQCTTLIEQATALLPAMTPLSSTAKKRLPKAKPGAESVIPILSSLATQYSLSSSLLSTETMATQFDESQALADLATKIGALDKAITDRQFALQSAAWTTATSVYTMLSRLGRDNAQLESSLAPVQQFFARRSAAAKKAHPKTAKGKAALAAQKQATASSSSSATTSPTPLPAGGVSPPATNGASSALHAP